MSRKKKKEEKREQLAIKDFFDRILPGVLKFYSDHYICGILTAVCGPSKNIHLPPRNRPFSDSWQTAPMSPYGSTTGWWTMRNSTGSSKTQPAQPASLRRG